jgi:hypothetical protein
MVIERIVDLQGYLKLPFDNLAKQHFIHITEIVNGKTITFSATVHTVINLNIKEAYDKYALPTDTYNRSR